VALLENPDLFWRYRADFGFRLITELFKRRPGEERTYEVIFTSLIRDIEQAFALNPDRHQVWRDFFVDANTGWLYLRRGDDYYTTGEYELALADYEEATRRIRPDSENATNDVTDATFKAGLTALRLQRFDAARSWYTAGIDLVERYEGNDTALNSARAALEILLDENPTLASVGEPILEDLDETR
jgi:tetratricopeptide (TPR) repeat protein